MTAEADAAVTQRWCARLLEFLPGFVAAHPALRGLPSSSSIALHGSTTLGIDDAFSDLDLWMLLSSEDLAAVDQRSQTRFFEFVLDGKAGHLQAESLQQFRRRVEGCEMDMIYQLRRAEVLTDGTGQMAELRSLARRPMRPKVSEALFFWHYVEMRSEHRACDNPIERGDSVALLLSLPKVLGHALRAAMVLDGEPYPYDKWLYQASRATPTGASLQANVVRIVELLSQDALRQGGPEREHPLGLELRAIRQALIRAANDKGIAAPWLEKWWLHMDAAAEAIRGLHW